MLLTGFPALKTKITDQKIINQKYSLPLPPEKERILFLDISHMAQKEASSEARQQGVTHNKLFNAKS